MKLEGFDTLPQLAKAKDHPLPKKLYEWAIENGYEVKNQYLYFLIHMEDDYTVCFSRASFGLQCYYMGYGYDTIDKQIEDFQDLDEITDWILYWQRNLTTIRTQAIEWVTSQMTGRQSSKSKKYEQVWERKMQEFYEMVRNGGLPNNI